MLDFNQIPKELSASAPQEPTSLVVLVRVELSCVQQDAMFLTHENQSAAYRFVFRALALRR